MAFLGISRYWNTNANLCLAMTALSVFLVPHIQSRPQELNQARSGNDNALNESLYRCL
jgi:hypothetical protein